jgi:hypothetical protein
MCVGIVTNTLQFLYSNIYYQQSPQEHFHL